MMGLVLRKCLLVLRDAIAHRKLNVNDGTNHPSLKTCSRELAQLTFCAILWNETSEKARDEKIKLSQVGTGATARLLLLPLPGHKLGERLKEKPAVSL